MTPTPLVSVIIPTYNRAHTLHRALASVHSQTYANIETIVIDDASTDETQALLLKEENVTGIRLPKNKGVSFARNRGIEQAKGTYIALLDSDDAWEKKKLATQIARMERDGILVAQTEEKWIRNGVRVNPMKKHAKPPRIAYADLLPLCRVSPSAVVIHKDVFARVGLFDETFPVCEDYEMWLRIRPITPIHTFPEAHTIKYGGQSDQLSRAYTAIDYYRVRALDKALRSGMLAPYEIAMTLAMMEEKCAILIQGYRKHGNPRAAEECERILHAAKTHRLAP